jgi:hypothetical protein
MSAPLFDAESHPSTYGQNNSWSHTVGAGGNRIAIVVTGTHNGNVAPSTVTFGGVAMTLLADYNGNYRRVCVYYLLSPALGVNTVVVNWGSSLSYLPSVACLTLYDVLQSGPFRTNSGQTGTTSPVNKTIASAVDDLVFDAIVEFGNGLTNDAGQTIRYLNNAASHISMGVSTKAGAASVITTWTKAGTGDTNHVIYSLSLIPDSLDRVLSEGFTISDNIEAFNLSDTLAESMAFGDNIQGGFEYEGDTAEGFTVHDAIEVHIESAHEAHEEFTINDNIAVETETAITEAAAFSDAATPQMEYAGSPLAENMGFGASMDAEFIKPIRRYKVPYQAKGRHLTIKFRNAEPGQTLMLLDVYAKILPLVGMTNSDKVQFRGQGNHLTVKFRNSALNEVLHLLYCAMTIRKTLQ